MVIEKGLPALMGLRWLLGLWGLTIEDITNRRCRYLHAPNLQLMACCNQKPQSLTDAPRNCHALSSLKATIAAMYDLCHYVDHEGQDLFARWLNKLRDRQAQARIAARLIRLQNGNFGDCKPVGDGVWELRVDWGAGYRVYYAIEGKRVVLLCDGGDKRTQTEDIARAIGRWNE